MASNSEGKKRDEKSEIMRQERMKNHYQQPRDNRLLGFIRNNITNHIRRHFAILWRRDVWLSQEEEREKSFYLALFVSLGLISLWLIRALTLFV